jgi:hypothetical protein
MGTALIVTDAGKAYIKAMGNRQGPHPLACEWVATQLAAWFGLPTFDIAILTIDATRDEIPFLRGDQAASGPAFVARHVSEHTWGGSANELDSLVNPEDLSRLVVFDTWTLNCDRHPPDLATRRPNPDNVYLADEGTPDGHFRLMAMDHTHCFTCGRDLNKRVGYIDRIQDERIYGLFPEFLARLSRTAIEAARGRLREVDQAPVQDILRVVPREWQVPQAAFGPWEDLIRRRATFVADTLIDHLLAQCL